MKIKKRENTFAAYRDENDANGNNMDSRIKVGDSLGSISIKTGKFVGNTVCFYELNTHRDNYVQKIVNEVIEDFKNDFRVHNYTSIEVFLKSVPIDKVLQNLPAELQRKFK